MSRMMYIAIFGILVTVLVVGAFEMGRQYNAVYYKPQAPSGLAVTTLPQKPTPVIQDCPVLESCIYNDHFGYKLIRFKHKDGTQCYGIRPYDKGKFEAMWCEK